MIWRSIQTLLALAFATPQSINTLSIGLAAGEGGWDLEDSNHYRKK